MQRAHAGLISLLGGNTEVEQDLHRGEITFICRVHEGALFIALQLSLGFGMGRRDGFCLCLVAAMARAEAFFADEWGRLNEMLSELGRPQIVSDLP